MPEESKSPGPTAASVTAAQSKEIEDKYSELGIKLLGIKGRLNLKQDFDKWSSKGTSSIPESAWQVTKQDLTQLTNDVKAIVEEYNRIEAEEQGTKDQDPPQDGPGASQA